MLDDIGFNISAPVILVMTIAYLAVAFPLAYGFYLLHIYALGWIYGLIGRGMGGQGTGEDLRAANAWSLLTFATYNLLLIPVMPFMNQYNDPYYFENPDFNPITLIPLLFMIFGSLAFLVYAFVIHVKCVAEAHRFSGWNAFAVVVLTMMIGMALLVVTSIAMIAVIVGIFSAAGVA